MPAQLTDDARVWCSAFSHFAGSGPQALAEHVEYAEAQVVSALESRTGRSQRGAGRLPSLSCCQRGLILPSRAVLSLCGLACAYICAYTRMPVCEMLCTVLVDAHSRNPLFLALFLLHSSSNPRSVVIAGVDRGPVDSFATPLREHHASGVCPGHHHLLPGDQQAPLPRQRRRSSLPPHPPPRLVQSNVRKLEVQSLQWNKVERVVTHVRESSQRHQGEGDNDAQGRRGVVQQFRSRHRHEDRDRSNQAHQHGINNQRENEFA